jgi:hypothetical protein
MNVGRDCVGHQPDCPLARNLHETWERKRWIGTALPDSIRSGADKIHLMDVDFVSSHL